MKAKKRSRKRRAAIMIVALAALLAVTLCGAQLLRSLTLAHRQRQQDQWATQALWLADSGLARAFIRLETDAEYSGETWRPATGKEAGSDSEAAGRVVIAVHKDPDNPASRRVRVEAAYPDDPAHRVLQVREQVISLTQPGVAP